jgi:hypothetical protein
MDYTSKFRDICMPLYTDYLLEHKRFKVNKFTPKRKGSGLLYYIKLSKVNIDGILTSSVLGGVNSKVNSNSIYNIDIDIDNIVTVDVLSGTSSKYSNIYNSNNSNNIDNICNIASPVLSGYTPKFNKTNKTIASHALKVSESERELTFLPELICYKIGYTSRSIADRLATMDIQPNVKVSIIATLWFGRAVDAYNMEQILHSKYRSKRYYGEKMVGNGYSECYVEDVLGLLYS